MSYFEDLGAVAAVPWSLVSGVAVPLDAPTLALFQTIQRDINAILAKMGKSLIDVDGRIGSKTVSAMRTIVLAHGTGAVAGGDITATMIASNTVAALSELGSLMQRLGAGFVPDPSPTSKPSTVKPDGTIDNPPDSAMSPTTLVIAAVAIGAVVALVSKKRKGRRR